MATKSAVKKPYAGSIGTGDAIAGKGAQAGEATPFAGMPRLKPLRDHVESLGPGRKSVKAARAQVARLYEHGDALALARVASGEDVPDFLNPQDRKGVANLAGQGFRALLEKNGVEWVLRETAPASGETREYVDSRLLPGRKR